MELIPITHITHSVFAAVYTLYEEAFPKNERRDKNDFIRIFETQDKFKCTAILHNEKFIGFITTWHFPDFIYVEHFAIASQWREKKIGGQVLDVFTQNYPIPILLEVEVPDNELSKRRVGFYKRHGFDIIETNYKQPPYRVSDDFTPMYLMCTHKNITDHQFSEFQKTVYNTYS